MKDKKFIGYVMHSDIKDYIKHLETSNQDMLDALIQSIEDRTAMWERMQVTGPTEAEYIRHCRDIMLVEKVSEKIWKEIIKIKK